MPLPNLGLTASKDNYTAKQGNTNLAVELDGGDPRIRKDKLGAAGLVDVMWQLNPANFDYFMAFYRRQTDYGSLPFTCDLILDTKTVQTYTVKIVPDSLKAPDSQSGETYIVRAQLYVTPIIPATGTDDAIVTAGPQ